MTSDLMKKMNFQRCVLGVLCASLAPACLLFGLLGMHTNLPYWWCSVSATYYANSKICMIGLLFATSVFFFTYHGYDWKDVLCNTVQAIAALGVIIFPCSTPGCPDNVGLFYLPVNLSHIFHCISASVLFLAFGVNVMFLFTLGDERNQQKMKRNILYRFCGGLIFTFILLQALSSTVVDFPDWFPMTMINEFVMLEAYAVAWLTKCGLFKKLNDN